DGIRDFHVTGVQTCALPICWLHRSRSSYAERVESCRPTTCPLPPTSSSRSADEDVPAAEAVRSDRVGLSADRNIPSGGPPGTSKIGRASCREKVKSASGAEV